jgi:Domain of Unknown Function (DUF930)
MRRLALTIGATLILATPATALDARFERSLERLAPIDRLEQLCDYVAMQEIRKDHKSFRPDRAVAGNAPHIKDHAIVATDGAFRSRKKWYALSYSCTAAADHLAVTSFKYKIGEEIPEAKWASYGLWE